MRLEELINKNYKQLNDNDLYIWKYITTHRKECEKLSIDELAERCHVSRTTILRFSKRVGLKGYAELKVYLRIDNQTSKYQQTGVDLVYEKYTKYMNEIKNKDLTNVIKLIANAKDGYVYSTGYIQNHVASELKRSFLFLDKLFFNIKSMNETYAFVDIIDHQDVIVMISHSGENKQVLDFAKKLKAKSVPIIAITATKNNTLAQLADESLYVETPSIPNPLGPRHEGQMAYFLLIDFLVVKYLDYYERILNDNTRGNG